MKAIASSAGGTQGARWLCRVICGLTFAAAAATLGLRAVLGDEFGSIWLAATESARGILETIRLRDVHPPTHYLLLHFWGLIFGYGDAAMRASSLVFTALALTTMASLARRWTRDDLPRALPLVLLATAPVLWSMGITARYYSAAAWLGLVSTSCYLRWLRDGGVCRWWALVAAMVATLYLNYLTAGVLVVSQALHVLTSVGLRGGRQKTLAWIGAQAAATLAAAPVIIWNLLPLVTGESGAAGSVAREGVSGLAALPVVLAGHLYTLFTGGIPYPWRFEVVLPAVLGGCLAAWSWFRCADKEERRDAMWLVAFPFVMTTVAIAIYLPSAGYFRGLLRAGYVPLLAWILLARGVASIPAMPRRNTVVVLVLVANLACLWQLFLNRPSIVQDHPVKEIINFIDGESRGRRDIAVVHPFVHGWGDAIARYRPAWTARGLTDSDSIDEVQVIARDLVGNVSNELWIVRQNRFSHRAADLTALAEQQGYVRFASRDFQPQDARDLRFKEWIKSVTALGFRSDSSYPYILTVQGFRRGSP